MRPDFSLIWGADNAPFTPIEASDYTAGWVFRTGAPPRRVNFDYFQNLSDQRTAWLGEQMLLAVGHEWQNDVSYNAYAVVRSPVNGQLYRSLAGSNLNNEPSVSGSQWAIGVVASGSLPLGYFSGFTMSNNVGAPNTTVDTSPGSARSSDNTVDITLTSTISGVLQSSGAWTAGTGQNKLDTGAKAANSTYHWFVIRNSATGVGDVLFSLSPTAPAMPSGWSGFRRGGHFWTDASGNIERFIDRGDGFFDCVTPKIIATTLGVAPATILVPIPAMSGIATQMTLQAAIVGDGVAIRLSSPEQTDAATGVTPSNWTGGVIANAGGGSDTEVASGEFEVFGDTTGQVRVRTATSAGNCGYRIILMRWRESR